MTDQNWRRVEELYHAALEREPEERAAFLSEVCVDEDEVCREVESLLGYTGNEHQHHVLDQPAWSHLPSPPNNSTSKIKPALAAGRTLGPYRIIECVGIGGMGEVYRACEWKLGRDVAIKILPEAFSDRTERLDGFAREAQVLASMNHPNIATVYGLEESDGVRALVMEFVPGPTLADRIAPGPIPIDEALVLARQIAEALEYAHEKGVIHRDLKPANVKITPDGMVKLLDFGLAGPTGDLSSATSTPRGVMGTAAYMSPEQARGKPVDRRADIWAFGAVLYEMLTGRRPFDGQSASDALKQVITKEPDWEALPKDTPVQIRRLIDRCLQKDARTRLQAIGEARIAIDDGPPGPVDVKPSSRQRNAGWLTAAVLAIASAVLAAGWWHESQPTGHPLIRLNLALGPDMQIPSNRVGGLLAISPDGSRLVVTVRGGDGRQRLAVRLLDQKQFTPLPGSEEAVAPFFSPDGQFIAFFTGRNLKRISASGGAPVTLCDALEAQGASWGDDGNIILALTDGGLLRVPARGGTPTPLSQLDRQKREVTHRWPQVLPGSKAILFTAHTHHGNYDESAIEVLSLKTGERKTLLRGGFQPRYISSGHLIYVHQTTLFAAPFDLDRLALKGEPVAIVEDLTSSSLGASFDVSRSGTFVYFSSAATQSGSSIFWLDRSGKTEPLQPAPGAYFDPVFSPDGQRLAFSSSNGRGSDIWVRELAHGSLSRRSFLPGRNFAPVWSPDGKYIVFASSSPAAPGIYWLRADGGAEAQRLTSGELAEWPSSFSPDGSRLTMTGEGARVELLQAPVEVGLEHLRLGELEPLEQSTLAKASLNIGSPKISPDGRWLAYISNETGVNEVYVSPFLRPEIGHSGKWQVSTGGARYPIWSRNGRELFFESSDRRIMVLAYSVRSASFVPGHTRVWSERRLLDLDTAYNYALGPDGRRFAVVLTAEDRAGQAGDNQLAVLVNLFDELRRRVPVDR